MLFIEFRKLIEERSKFDPNDLAIERQWEKMIKVFSADIDKTILFLDGMYSR